MALKLKSTFFIILSKIALCTAFNPKTWPSNKEIEANNSSDPWGPSPWGSEEKEREILDIGWGSGEEEDEEWVSNGFFILFIVIGIIVVMALIFICLCCLCTEKNSKDYEEDNYDSREKAIKTILKIENQISKGSKKAVGMSEPNLTHLLSTTPNVNEIVNQLSQQLAPGSLQNVKMRGSNIDISDRRQSLPLRYNRTSQSNLSISDIAKVHPVLPEDGLRGCNFKASEAAMALGEASINPRKARSTLPRERLYPDVNGLSLMNASSLSKSGHLYNKRASVSSSNSSRIHTPITGESSLAITSSGSSADEFKPRGLNNAPKRYNAIAVDRKMKSRSLHRLSYNSQNPESIQEVSRRQNAAPSGDRTSESRSVQRLSYYSPSRRKPIQEAVDEGIEEQTAKYNDLEQSKRAKSLSNLYETIEPVHGETRRGGNLNEHSHLRNKIRQTKGDRSSKTRSLYRNSYHNPNEVIAEATDEAVDELKRDIKTVVQVHVSSSDIDSD